MHFCYLSIATAMSDAIAFPPIYHQFLIWLFWVADGDASASAWGTSRDVFPQHHKAHNAGVMATLSSSDRIEYCLIISAFYFFKSSTNIWRCYHKFSGKLFQQNKPFHLQNSFVWNTKFLEKTEEKYIRNL